MIMTEYVLDLVMSREEQERRVREIKEAKPGTIFPTDTSRDGEFDTIQTLFYRAKVPYILKIHGDTALWIKGTS